MKKLLLSLIIVLGFTSCEDPVDIEIDNGISQFSIDGFINNLPSKQTISLKKSKDFFDRASQSPVLDALVKIVDSEGKEYLFLDIDNNGEYSWSDSVLVHENLSYNLEVSHNGELYTSEEIANPVPKIDSLNVSSETFGGRGDLDEGQFQLEMISYDIAGRTDYYWIKTLRNDSIDQRTDAITVTIDGGGAGADGVLFIPPVRIFGVNNFQRPYQTGENVKVQIHSINKNTFLFFNQVTNQINNSGLFAVPSSNVRTNIESSSNKIEKKAIGIFSVSMVSESEKDI